MKRPVFSRFTDSYTHLKVKMTSLSDASEGLTHDSKISYNNYRRHANYSCYSSMYPESDLVRSASDLNGTVFEQTAKPSAAIFLPAGASNCWRIRIRIQLHSADKFDYCSQETSQKRIRICRSIRARQFVCNAHAHESNIY
jgi:hypothetical protein